MVLKVCKLPKLGDVKIKKRFAIFPKKIYTKNVVTTIFFQHYYEVYRYTTLPVTWKHYWSFEKEVLSIEEIK